MFERRTSQQNGVEVELREQRKLSAEERQKTVYESHRHRVFSVSYYMTANEVEAETILTRTFVTAFEVQPEPDQGSVDRALVSELERRFCLDPSEAAILEAGALQNHKPARRTDMEEALWALPPLERLVFLLRDVEGYSTEKAAQLLDKTTPEVQMTLFSARIRMRNALSSLQQRRQSQIEDDSTPA